MRVKSSPGYILGIDPGLGGAFVVTDGIGYIRSYPMPVETRGKEKRIRYQDVRTLLVSIVKDPPSELPVFLERAVAFGMGTKAAFNYGAGFETLLIAIEELQFPLTLVEPGKWAKEMHQGIRADLKPKAKSLIAVGRLFPRLVRHLPKKPRGGLHDGPVDALLIAGWGLRQLGRGVPTDFY